MDTAVVVEISRDCNKQGGPEPGFTQQSTIDPMLREIYVMSGLVQDRDLSPEQVKSNLWVYNIESGSWARVVSPASDPQPFPRWAHQLVYDATNRVHYLFGGNPGDAASTDRLGDFWSLSLSRYMCCVYNSN